MRDSGFDEALKERGLAVILMVIQYQNLRELDPSDVLTLLQIPRINKVIQRVSASFDISQFVRALAQTVMSNDNVEIGDALNALVEKVLKLKALMNMKVTFATISSILQHLLESDEQKEVALRLLKQLEDINIETYN